MFIAYSELVLLLLFSQAQLYMGLFSGSKNSSSLVFNRIRLFPLEVLIEFCFPLKHGFSFTISISNLNECTSQSSSQLEGIAKYFLVLCFDSAAYLLRLSLFNQPVVVLSLSVHDQRTCRTDRIYISMNLSCQHSRKRPHSLPISIEPACIQFPPNGQH